MLAAQIPDYPAPGYVEYFTIKPQLFDSQGHARVDAPDEPVLSFLQRYDGQAIADRLRNDYLVVLGGRHDWRNFEQQYSRFVLNDDTQVKCYALEARAARGENVADAARALLVDPKWYGDGCVDLIVALGRASNSQATMSGSRFVSPTNRTTRTRARRSSMHSDRNARTRRSSTTPPARRRSISRAASCRTRRRIS